MSSVDELTPRQDAVETNVEAPAIAASALGGLFSISMPAMSMRQLLAAIVLATALPLVALALLVHQQLVANERQASGLNLLKCRIQAFQLHTGVGRGEVPVRLGVVGVAA